MSIILEGKYLRGYIHLIVRKNFQWSENKLWCGNGLQTKILLGIMEKQKLLCFVAKTDFI